MHKKIALLPGDGIGPEIMAEAKRVLDAIDKHQQFELFYADIGGVAYEKYGTHFPKETQKICERADAILFASVGGAISESHLEKWRNCEANSILSLRKNFNLSTNLRPVTLYPSLTSISPLKENRIHDGIDILILRELVGDIYFGEKKQVVENNQRIAIDVAEYNENQIAVIAHFAFQAARIRKQKVTSVDKANVLATSKLWRIVVSEIAKDYPDITLEHMLVDNCAMQLILNPKQFDVILTANLFGDILSDLASAIPGSLGLMPSASLNQKGFGLYEPSGGSAPDIANKNIANPIGQILSLALMLRYSFQMNEEAVHIENAVKKALRAGFRTKDIWTESNTLVGTKEITDVILSFI